MSVEPKSATQIAADYAAAQLKTTVPPVVPPVIPPVVPPIVPPVAISEVPPVNTPEPKVRYKIHEPVEAIKSSGLYGTMKDYLKPDYFDEIKDLPEMDKITLTDFFKKDNWKPEELKTVDMGAVSKIKMHTLFPEVFPDKGNITPEPTEVVPPVIPPIGSGNLEEMEKPELIIEYKKMQSDKDLKLEELQTEFNTFKTNKPGEESDILRDFEGLKTDFIGTYNKLKDKYGLPSIDLVRTQFTSNDNITSRLQQYQENELKTVIEKKHSLEQGEFDYEANDAGKAGTPSYDWDDLSNRKKQSLLTEQETLANHDVGVAQKAQEQQVQDTEWYAQAYFEGDKAKVEEKINLMNATMTAVSKGEDTYEKHPFALRNLLEGFFHEELQTSAVESAVQELTAKFATQGMYLPGTEFPTDPTSVTSAPVIHETFTKEEKANSPMFGSMGRTLKALN